MVPRDEKISAVNRELFSEYESRATAGPQRFISFRLFGFGFALDPESPLTAAMILLLAALGGFLLNFTPCVLPLIPIKLISLSNAAAADRRRCLNLGLFTFAGVLAFWVALGGIVSMVSGFTSTHQLFQYPAFTIGVGLIIAVMAIGMFGVYSVRLPGLIYALNPRQETLAGALGVGVLTAVLSTPCTAPFMGTAAAWAATQEPAVTIATFSAIGAGMGLPSLLAAFPRLVRRLPKTGTGERTAQAGHGDPHAGGGRLLHRHRPRHAAVRPGRHGRPALLVAGDDPVRRRRRMDRPSRGSGYRPARGQKPSGPLWAQRSWPSASTAPCA